MKDNRHKIVFLICFIAIVVGSAYSLQLEVEPVAQKQSVIETYLNHDGYLVQVKTKSAKSTKEEQATEIIHYMKQEHASFDALLDEGTQLNHVSIDDNTLTYHFDQLQYPKNHERRVWEALVFAGTQFEGVKKVALTIKDKTCKTMPLNHMPLGNQDRSIGINQLKSNQIYLHEGKDRLLYYETEIGDKTYPVLQSVRMKDNNDYDEFLDLLLKPVASTLPYDSILSHKKILKIAPCEIEKDVLHLYLNHNILKKDKEVDEKIVKTLKQNFMQFEEIRYLTIHVDDMVISVDGKNKIALGNK